MGNQIDSYWGLHCSSFGEALLAGALLPPESTHPALWGLTWPSHICAIHQVEMGLRASTPPNVENYVGLDSHVRLYV